MRYGSESVFDDWRYPCKECDSKRCRGTPHCKRWKEWFLSVWNEVCKPFRQARDERDMRYGR